MEYAQLLNPQNVIVERCSRSAWEQITKIHEQKLTQNQNDIFGLKKEKWYGVQYYLTQIPSETVSQWSTSNSNTDTDYLYLPPPNPYIPKNLQLHPSLPPEAHTPRIQLPMSPPILIHASPSGRLWHKLDNRYALPRSSIKLLRHSPTTNRIFKQSSWQYDTTKAMHATLLFTVFMDATAQETYDADLAGLDFSLSHTTEGWQLSAGGYSERLADLATHILDIFFNQSHVFLQHKFVTAAQDRLVRNLNSYLLSNRADTIANYYTVQLLEGLSGGVDEKIIAVENITLDTLKQYYQQLVADQNGTWDCLVMGNVASDDATAFYQKVQNVGGQPKGGWSSGSVQRGLPISSSTSLHFPSLNKSEENGAVLVTFQSPIRGFNGAQQQQQATHHCPDESLRYSSALRLISHMLREPLFDELRTKQQLGYIVSSYYDLNFDSAISNMNDADNTINTSTTTFVDSIVVSVLSQKIPPEEILIRIDEFLTSFRDTLAEMPQDEIRHHQDALSKKMLKPVQKLGAESSRWFSKIRRYAPEISSSYDDNAHVKEIPWNSVDQLAEGIRQLQKEDLVQVWDAVITGKTRARIVSHVYGNKFPMTTSTGVLGGGNWFFLKRRIQNMETLLNARRSLPSYTQKSSCSKNDWFVRMQRRRMGMAAVAAVGVSLGIYALSFPDKKRTEVSDSDGLWSRSIRMFLRR